MLTSGNVQVCCQKLGDGRLTGRENARTLVGKVGINGRLECALVGKELIDVVVWVSGIWHGMGVYSCMDVRMWVMWHR